jgi:ferredoxin
MMAYVILGAGGISLLVALVWTVQGVFHLWAQRKAASAYVAPPAGPVMVTLEGKGEFAPEPGVLLHTLWEHLPQAECQSGECGGCKLRLLEGKVSWIREPVAAINRQTHILACSCVPLGSVRCATD